MHCIHINRVTEDSMINYLSTVEQSGREATFFFWSAITSSEIFIFVFEFFNVYIFNKCLENNPMNNCCQKCCFNLVTCIAFILKRDFIFVQHSWFLAMILFYYGNCFAWLNPAIYLGCAITILVLIILYKIRFCLISPKMENHYVADLIYVQTIKYILLCAWPTQFIILLPLHHKCPIISFGGIFFSFITTIICSIFYCLFWRLKKYITGSMEDNTKNIEDNNDDNDYQIMS